MSDQISVEGKEYISSRRASELSGYSQDYIGQLARGRHIDAQRVGGLWYVRVESLQNYKTTAEAYKPEPPVRKQVADPDSLISFDGKDYVSAARAAKITGYHQDYVGQLARSSTVMARQVGNRWYTERESILKHKKEKDTLLAAVQAESVGLLRSETPKMSPEAKEKGYAAENQYFTYTNDGGDLMPALRGSDDSRALPDSFEGENEERTPTAIPIRVLQPKKHEEILHHAGHVKHVKSRGRIHGKTISYAALGAMAFTIVIVLMFGFSTVGKSTMYAAGASSSGYTASAAEAFTRLGDLLENLLVPELSYKRTR